MSPRLRLTIAAVLLAPAVAPQTIEYRILKEGVLEDRLRLAHPKVAERYKRLRALFEETGCPDLQTQKVAASKEPNLICVVNGAAGAAGTPRRIVVGAHFDSAGGDGLIDNWTGAILLPSLAEFMREKPRRHTFHFAGFAAEERGLLGSLAYLRSIPKADRHLIDAVLTMDSLGLTPTKFWPNSSTSELVKMTARLAHALKLDFAGVNLDQVGSTDSMTFFRAKIPVLSLHSVTQQTWQLINSPKDVRASLSWKDYYDTHRLIFALLVYLDEALP